MRINHYILALIFAGLIAPTHGAILYFDSFENPPDVAGNNPVGWNVSSTGIVVASGFASEGTQSLFIRDGSGRDVTQSSAVTITDFQDLVFTFDFAVTSGMESADGLTGFSIDFGSGFQTVVRDMGAPNGIDATYIGTQFTLPNADGGTPNAFVSYSITVPTSYYVDVLGATSFRMQFSTTSSAGSEAFRLDAVSVATVPEPATSALMLGGLAAMVGLRKRARRG